MGSPGTNGLLPHAREIATTVETKNNESVTVETDQEGVDSSLHKLVDGLRGTKGLFLTMDSPFLLPYNKDVNPTDYVTATTEENGILTTVETQISTGTIRTVSTMNGEPISLVVNSGYQLNKNGEIIEGSKPTVQFEINQLTNGAHSIILSQNIDTPNSFFSQDSVAQNLVDEHSKNPPGLLIVDKLTNSSGQIEESNYKYIMLERDEDESAEVKAEANEMAAIIREIRSISSNPA